jgi:hypothetical protein
MGSIFARAAGRIIAASIADNPFAVNLMPSAALSVSSFLAESALKTAP